MSSKELKNCFSLLDGYSGIFSLNKDLELFCPIEWATLNAAEPTETTVSIIELLEIGVWGRYDHEPTVRVKTLSTSKGW